MRTFLTHHYRKNIRRIKLVVTGVVDFLIYVLSPKRKIDISKEGHRTYLFLVHDLPPHFARLVKWMRRSANVNAVLLVAESGEFTDFNTERFSQIFTFRSTWQLRHKMSVLKGYDIIYTSGAIAWPMRIAMEKSSAPVVYDVKDTYIVNYGFNPPQLYMRLDLKNEKYAFIHADGVVSQSIEAYFAYRYYQIPKRPPALFFPLYCDDDYCVSGPPAYPAEEIHLVYVGGFYGSASSKAHFGNEIFFDIIDKFTSQRVHFHLYPAPRINKSIVQEYREYAKKTPYLHVHDPIRQDRLAEEISQYHFGLIPFFDERTTRLKAKRERATALKIFNYIEAGLPVLISNHVVFEKWLVSRYGSAIGIEARDLDRIREIVESCNYSALRSQVLVKRQNILLSEHIHRFLHFCDKIISTSRNQTDSKS